MVTLLGEAATVDPVASTLPGAAVLLGLGAYKIATTVIEKRRNGNGKSEQQLCMQCRDTIRDTSATVIRLEQAHAKALEDTREAQQEELNVLRENRGLLRGILAAVSRDGRK